MAKKNITVTCLKVDEKATMRQIRKLGGRDIEKATICNAEGEPVGVELRANVSSRRYDSKKSDRLFKIADSVARTVEA